MPQIREQIAMVHLPPSKTLKYLFHVRKTNLRCASRAPQVLLCIEPPGSAGGSGKALAIRMKEKLLLVR